MRLAINGAAGRMGNRLIALGSDDEACELVCAADGASSSNLGKDAGTLAGIEPINIAVTAELENEPQAVIDFSSPQGAIDAIEFCRQNATPLVMASTGLEDSTIESLRALSDEVAVCWAPNMSLAVNLTMKLVEQAANALNSQSSGVDVEIIETHHRFKADSPSGTALKFGEIVANSMGQTNHQHGREGAVGQRPQNEIGYHAIRAGDDPGQHTVLFGMLGEKISINVAASNRDCYASGAIAAAKFIVGKDAGMYSMMDVLGI